MTESTRYNLDLELFSEFALESLDSLAEVENLLVELENNPENMDIVQQIFRPVHSMKGNAAFFNLSQTKTLAHDMENVLDRVRKRSLAVDKEVIDLILIGVDMLRRMIGRVPEGLAEVEDQDAYDGLLSAINILLSDEADKASCNRTLYNQAMDLLSLIREEAGDTLSADLNERIIGLLEASRKSDGQENEKKVDLGALASAAQETQAPTAEKADAGKPPAHKDEHQKTIRVSEQKVDDFLEFVSELVILSEGMNQVGMELATSQVDRGVRSRFSEINSTFHDLAEGLEKAILSIRMVAASSLTRKLPRMVRDLSNSLKKPARITIEGEEIEIDKSLIEALDGPMTHIIRNSMDHGFETPDQRQAAGKPPIGELSLVVSKTDDMVVFTISDDGRGIDAEAVRQKAISSGLLTERDAQALTHDETLQLVFASGLSTAKVVSDVSGRGVGMDVVRTSIEELGGTIRLQSELGKGTTVTLLLPYNITTVVEKVLVVRLGDRQFSIPESMVMEVVRTTQDKGQCSPAGEVIQIRNDIYRVVRLADVLRIRSNVDSLKDGALVLVRVTGQRVSLVVDEVVSLQQVIIRNVDGDVLDPNIIQGIGMHGDGSLSPVLNVVEMIKTLATHYHSDCRQAADIS